MSLMLADFFVAAVSFSVMVGCFDGLPANVQLIAVSFGVGFLLRSMPCECHHRKDDEKDRLKDDSSDDDW